MEIVKITPVFVGIILVAISMFMIIYIIIIFKVSDVFLTNKFKNQKMKKNKLLLIAALVITAFSACENSPTFAQKDATSLNNYVDSVESLTPVYTNAYWAEIDNGYQLR